MVIAVLALAGGTVVGILWARRGPEPASVDEALERFRGEPGDDTSSRSAPLRPTSGVYTYQGSGTEHLSFLATSQPQGPVLPATVLHEPGGCWTFRMEYSTNHDEIWRYCPRDETLVEIGGEVHQRFEFVGFSVDDVFTFTCRDAVSVRPSAEVGDSWSRPCRGSNDSGTESIMGGEYRFLGTDRLRIGTRSLRAYHYREHREISGDQSGETTIDLWFSVTDGLPLRNERSIEVESPSPVGTVTYTETGEWQLTSLRPRT
jgi:hypothetical protein